MNRLEKIMERKIRERILAGMFLLAAAFLGVEIHKYVLPVMTGRVLGKAEYCVVLDAGHGGSDPGKVGVNGTLEKDINLEIAKILREYLRERGVEVVMTRETPEGLCDLMEEGSKAQDMKRRVQLIEETQPDVTVSIHQNSFPQEKIRGAQTFYYEGSKEGERLAGEIQKQLIHQVDPENQRVEKSNNTYYLLKKTSGTTVIVECGFLSNYEEADKLSDETYQRQIAQAVGDGILVYLKAQKDGETPSPERKDGSFCTSVL